VKTLDDRSVSIPLANVLAGAVVVLFAVPMGWLYGRVTQESILSVLDGDPGWGTTAAVIAGILAGTYLHELIHMTSFRRIGKASKAGVGIGVHWKVLTPYAWCKEPISAAAYRWVAVLPGIVLGVIPFVVSLLVSEAWLAAWGVFFTLAASGDFLVLWLIRDLERATWIIDHTSRCGCAIVEGGVEP
jgi:Putative zincin peptidase